MEFETPIISPIVESLMVPIKKHLGFLVSSKSYIEDMNARMKQLNDTAQDMQNKKTQLTQTIKWYLNMCCDSWKMSKRWTIGFGCFNVAKRYKAGKQSSNILEKIDDLETRKFEIEWTNEQILLGMVVSSTSTLPSTSAPVHGGTQNSFESRGLIFNEALKSLDPDNQTQKMMALCGSKECCWGFKNVWLGCEGGLGKTLTQLPFNKLLQRKWVKL